MRVWGRLAPVALSATLAAGCMSWKKVGVSDAAVTPKQKLAAACIEDRSGREATLIEGEVAGKPAVTTEGVRVGLGAALVEPVDDGGIQVFAGQACLMQNRPICDNELYMKREARHYYLYWGEHYESAQALPATTTELVEQMKKRGIVDAVRALELDTTTVSEFKQLSAARKSRQQWSAVKFLMGVALQRAAKELGAAGAAVEGSGEQLAKESLNVQFEIDDSEKPLLQKNPKLAALFGTAKLAAGTSDFKVASLCIAPL